MPALNAGRFIAPAIRSLLAEREAVDLDIVVVDDGSTDDTRDIVASIARDFAEVFKRCDVIMGPTSPTTAFRIGEKMGDPVQMYLNDIYTIPANLAGLPGMSIPCGLDEKGLPVGLQIVGNYFAEARMLGIAHQYQQATDWHARTPPGIQ